MLFVCFVAFFGFKDHVLQVSNLNIRLIAKFVKSAVEDYLLAV